MAKHIAHVFLLGVHSLVTGSVHQLSRGHNASARSCTVARLLRRGIVHDCEGRVAGETCRARAAHDHTYVAGGPTTLECSSDGALEGPLPRVAPRPCEPPAFGSGVAHSCAGKSAGSSCWAYCEAGYSGRPALYECGVAGGAAALRAVGEPVSCAAAVAGPAPPAAAGRRLSACDASIESAGLDAADLDHNCAGKPAGEVCFVECANGYRGGGSRYQCANATFSPMPPATGVPTCVGSPCVYSFPQGRGVRHDCDGKTTGETCSATCDDGYTDTLGPQPQNFTCTGSQEFVGTSPDCAPRTCTIQGDLSDRYNASNCVGKRTGQTCSVLCRTGYTGMPSLFVCNGTTGHFDGEGIACEPVTCTSGPPEDAGLDTTSCAGVTTGQNCTVACAPGFQGQEQTWECKPSGFVNGTLPTCSSLVCPQEGLPTSTALANSCDGVSFGNRCNVYCNSGYGYAPGSSIEQWSCALNPSTGEVELSGDEPVCEPKPCRPGRYVGRFVEAGCEGIRTDQNCTYSCLPGFAAAPGFPSSEVFTCLSNGELVGTPPTCVEMQCDVPPSSAAHANTVTCAGKRYGEHCMVFCLDGYEGDSARWECALGSDNASVAFRGTYPTCTPQECFSESVTVGIQYAHNCEGVRTGESCSVQCAEGYEGAPENFTCSPSRFLEGTLPECLEITSTSTASSSTSTASSTRSTTTNSTVTITTTTITNSTVTITTPSTGTTTRNETSTTVTNTTSTVAPVTSTETTTEVATTTESDTTISTITTLALATSATTTLTATTLTSATTLSETLPAGMLRTVLGTMELSVTNANAFVADPNALAAVNQFLASTVGIDASYVTSVLGLARRLAASSHMRRLQGSNVQADYVVTVDPASGVTAEQIEGDLRALEDNRAQASSGLSYVLDAEDATGYNPEFQGMSGIRQGTVEATTTTEPVQPAPPPSASPGDDDSGATLTVIIVILVVVIAVIAIGITYVVHRRRQQAKESLANNVVGNEPPAADVESNVLDSVPDEVPLALTQESPPVHQASRTPIKMSL